jgi:hypothetical protein
MPAQQPPKTPPGPKETNLVRDEDQDEHTRPGIPRPGEQPDQEQQPFAPPQRGQGSPLPTRGSSQMIPPSTGNPDLDPAGMTPRQYIDPRQQNPLTPQGMLYDPRQLLDRQRGHDPHSNINVPPGARFDPFGPPDPSQVGPGRGPLPTSQFGVPDPDHLEPPGAPRSLGKTLKGPWPPGGRGFPPPGGSGGSPFM